MENLVAIIAILSVFGTIAAIFIMPGFFKLRAQREMHKSVRAAISQGQALPAELIDVMTRDVRRRLPSRSRDIRRGVMLVAGAVGLALMSLVIGVSINLTSDSNFGNVLLALACLPFTMGLAYLALAALNKDKS